MLKILLEVYIFPLAVSLPGDGALGGRSHSRCMWFVTNTPAPKIFVPFSNLVSSYQIRQYRRTASRLVFYCRRILP